MSTFFNTEDALPRSVPYIPSVILLREKVTFRCVILGTTYRIIAEHFLYMKCVKYTDANTIKTFIVIDQI